MTDEEQIRELIERWAQAAHRGDLDMVVAQHTEDMVMFDVPPPYQGIRGLDDYAESWPGFFGWQRAGAVFELVELEITAGSDAGFAYALLNCGTPDDLATRPGQLLRLTCGLVKRDGQWLIAHEHHSFPHPIPGEGEQELRELHQQWFDATATKDLGAMVAGIADDVVSYEHETPLAYQGIEAVREVCAAGLDVDGEVGWEMPELAVRADGDLAVAWGLNRMRVPTGDGDQTELWSRGTRVFARHRGGWQLVHQHLSYPRDPDTGLSVTALDPDRVQTVEKIQT